MQRNRPASRSSRPGLAVLTTLILALATGCSDSPTSSDPVTISISPAQATVGAGGTVQFTATVTGSSDTNLSWSTSSGTISGSGTTATLTAPAQGGSVTVTARRAADSSVSGTAQVTVTPVQVAVSPGSSSLLRGESISLTASVTGTQQTGVNWSASCGTVDGQGATVTFTAPGSPGECTVTATSTLDSSRSGEATTMILPDWRITSLSGTVGACTPLSCSYTAGLELANAGTGPADAEGYTVLRFDEALAGQTLSYSASPPTINGSVRILGPAAGMVTLDANTGGALARRGIAIVGGRLIAERIRVRDGTAQFGGGILATEEAELFLRDAELVGNLATVNGGGGLRVSVGSTAHLERVSVLDNRATGTSTPGAGVSVVSNSLLTWSDGLVQGNVVEDGWGAGIHTFNAEIELTDVEIRDNEVLGGASGGGGALLQGPGRVDFDGVLFAGNRAPDGTAGGGFRITAEGLETTIRNSRFEGNSAGSAGAFQVASNRVVMEDSQIVGNEGRSHTGGIVVFTGAEIDLLNVDIDDNVAGAGDAGGIRLLSNAIATLENVRIRGNQAQLRGGGIYSFTGSQVTMTGGEISGNTAVTNWGGGIHTIGGSFTLEGTELLENSAPGQGAAGGAAMLDDGAEFVMSGGRVSGNSATFGGGLWSRGSTIELEGVELSQNEASMQGGGIQALLDSDITLRDVVLSGNTSGANGGGGLAAFSGTRLLLEGSLVSGNSTEALGGGALLTFTEATILGTRIQENEAATFGGGLMISGATADVTIADSEILGNLAVFQGGGIQLSAGQLLMDRVLVAGNEAPNGGAGITVGGPAIVRNSTFHGNLGLGGLGAGGGVFAASIGNLVLENVTISGNRAVTGAGFRATGSATLNGVTLVGNSATDEGGGILAEANGAVTLRNTLVVANTQGEAPSNCSLAGSASIGSHGNNLSDDAACTPWFSQGSDTNGAGAGLSLDLAENGGATPTHALLAGSPAINGGNAATCLPTDQRGYGRNGTCDIGAFEFEGVAPATAPRVRGWEIYTPGIRLRPVGGAGPASEAGFAGGVLLPAPEILR